jgi:hypothetical protein
MSTDIPMSDVDHEYMNQQTTDGSLQGSRAKSAEPIDQSSQGGSVPFSQSHIHTLRGDTKIVPHTADSPPPTSRPESLEAPAGSTGLLTSGEGYYETSTPELFGAFGLGVMCSPSKKPGSKVKGSTGHPSGTSNQDSAAGAASVALPGPKVPSKQ